MIFRVPALIVLVSISSFGQDATVSGLVLDKTSKEPMSYVSVVLKSRADDQMITGAITGSDGRFALAGIPQGAYAVVFSFVGYANKEMPLLIGSLNRNFDLGKIEMDTQPQQLDELTISAQREMVSSNLDSKSFQLNDNVSQSGGSIMDAMRNLPGVTISPNGKVLLRGSENVSVLIDGKQSSLTGFANQKGLENIPASNIERIEIINNPSAKYNAAGMAGIINIVYKKTNEAGFHGEGGLALGVGEVNQRRANLPNISKKYAFTPKVNPSLSLNYKTAKANFFLQGDGIVRRRINANEFITRDYLTSSPDIQSQFLENRTQKLYNIKGGLDWSVSSKNTITLFALWQDEYHIDRGDVPYDNLETGQRLRLWTWAEDERTKFINYSANLNHRFVQPGHQMSVGYLYTGGGEDEFFPFTDSSSVRQSFDNTFLTVYEYVHSFTADYVKPLRAGRMEFGSRISLRNIPITYTLTPGQNSILDPNIGKWSRYSEDVYALYGNYVMELQKLDLEAGLRFEPSWVKYELDQANQYYPNNSYSYLPLFPNIRITHKINTENTLSVFFNRRVDRPGEFDVRPFPKYDDPEILKTGNPNLRPQFTRTYEVAYKKYWNTGSLFLSTFFRQIDQIFSRIFTQDVSSSYSIVNAIPSNLGAGTNLGFEVAFQQAINKSWKMDGSFNYYRNYINAYSGTTYYPYEQDFQSAASNINTWNMKINSSFKLPSGWELQVTSVYYAPDIIPQGKIEDRYSLDFGLKRKFAENRMEFRLSGTDILNTFQIQKQVQGDGFTLKGHNYYETQVFTVGLKVRF